MPAVGNEGFGAVQHVMVAVPNGARLHALQIRARCRFAHRNRAHHFATGKPGQVFLFLRVGAVMQQIRRNNFGMQAVADAAETRATQLLHLNDGKQLVRAHAAVLLRHRRAQETILTGLVPDLAIHIALLFPVGVEGCNFEFDKLAKAVAKSDVVRVEKRAFDHGDTFCDVEFILVTRLSSVTKCSGGAGFQSIFPAPSPGLQS